MQTLEQARGSSSLAPVAGPWSETISSAKWFYVEHELKWDKFQIPTASHAFIRFSRGILAALYDPSKDGAIFTSNISEPSSALKIECPSLIVTWKISFPYILSYHQDGILRLHNCLKRTTPQLDANLGDQKGSVHALAHDSNTGLTFLVLSQKVRVLNVENKEILDLPTPPDSVTDVVYCKAANGLLAVVTSKQVIVWDVASREMIYNWKSPHQLVSGKFKNLMLLAGTDDWKLFFWDFEAQPFKQNPPPSTIGKYSLMPRVGWCGHQTCRLGASYIHRRQCRKCCNFAKSDQETD